MSRLIDISQPVRPGVAGFPGDTVYAESRHFAIGPGCPVNVARVTMSTHSGTHADAPLHYAEDGEAIGGLELDAFIGPCRVIDARGGGALCLPDDIDAELDGVPPRVLLRLAEASDPNVWPSGFRALSATLIGHLAHKGVVLVGIDMPSIDPETSKDLPAHRAALEAGMRILENLVLAHVAPGDYELIALPIRLADLDAAPVRAVLRPL
ncbi:MAG: arylformamidase [Hyphomicrobiaceae bacterium]